jgi:hypothetical protein
MRHVLRVDPEKIEEAVDLVKEYEDGDEIDESQT